jgi:hypothetical protein
MTNPSNIVQTAQGKRKRKQPFRVLLEQYQHEAGGTFDPAEVAAMSAEEVRHSKPVEASLIAYLDRMAASLKPEGRAVALQARAYLTELRGRQAELFGQDYGQMFDLEEVTDEAVAMLRRGATVAELQGMVDWITGDMPADYLGKPVDEINEIAAGLGLRGQGNPTPLRAMLAQREGTKWFKLVNEK